MKGRPLQFSAVIGFSLTLLINAFTLWDGGASSFFSFVAYEGPFSLIVGIVQFLCIVISIALAPFLTGKLTRVRVLLAGTACALASSVSVAFLAVGSLMQGSFLLLVLDSALIGLSTGCSYALWAMVFYSFGRDGAMRGVVLSSAIFPLVYLVASRLLRSVLPLVLLGLAVVASVLLVACLSCVCFSQGPFRLPMTVAPSARRDLREVMLKPVACIALLGFASTLARQLCVASGVTAGTAMVYAMTGGTVAAVALFAYSLTVRRTTTYLARIPGLYILLYLLVAGGFVLVPFVGSWYLPLFAGITYSAFTVASILMIVGSFEAAQIIGVNPLKTYSIFASIVYLVAFAGSTIGGIARLGGEVDVPLSFLALAALYVLSLVLVLLRRPPVAFSAKASSARTAPEVSEDEDLSSKLEGPCAAAAQRFGLTSREQEVMELLAKGRDLPFIADALCISKGTVQSHSKRIYRKMGVHSKQELISELERVQGENFF